MFASHSLSYPLVHNPPDVILRRLQPAAVLEAEIAADPDFWACR